MHAHIKRPISGVVSTLGDLKTSVPYLSHTLKYPILWLQEDTTMHLLATVLRNLLGSYNFGSIKFGVYPSVKV